jgi:hypothetical protein
MVDMNYHSNRQQRTSTSPDPLLLHAIMAFLLGVMHTNISRSLQKQRSMYLLTGSMFKANMVFLSPHQLLVTMPRPSQGVPLAIQGPKGSWIAIPISKHDIRKALRSVEQIMSTLPQSINSLTFLKTLSRSIILMSLRYTIWMKKVFSLGLERE